MKSVKPGRGPSMMGGIVAVAIAIFGVLWTLGARSITSGMGMPDNSFDYIIGSDGSIMQRSSGFGIDTIFPLFGVVFVIIAIAIAVYNFKNATSKNRYSEYDITDHGEEPDPLNARFGGDQGEPDPFEGSDLFCPYCGTPAEDDYRYCKRYGKQLPDR